MTLKHLMIAVTLASGFAALPAPGDAQPRHHGWNNRPRMVRVCKRVRHHHRWERRCVWRRARR